MSRFTLTIFLVFAFVLFSCPKATIAVNSGKEVQALYVLGGSDGNDLALNDVWFSHDGVTWKEVTEKQNERFSPRVVHHVAEMNNTLYLIGGLDKTKTQRLNDVWKSSDGTTWERVTQTAQFAARQDHQVVAMGNSLYVIADFDGSKRFNDVWKSNDGARWSEVTPKDADKQAAVTAGSLFSARNVHQVVVKGSELYLIGGYDGTRLRDVWKSSDGATWKSVTKTAQFSDRSKHQAVVLKNEIYVIGGWNGKANNDVWKSTNGETWNEVTPKDVDKQAAVNNGSLFPVRRKHAAVVMNNKIYVIGGDNGLSGSDKKKLNDVWESEDGATWKRLTDSAAFPARNVHAVAVAKRKTKGINISIK